MQWPGENVRVKADLQTIPLHVRGGYVVPQQCPDINTKLSRKNPLKLLVALNTSRRATGKLFWDDGEGIDTIEKEQFDILDFDFDQVRYTFLYMLC